MLGLAVFVWRQLVLQRRGERALLDLRTFQARQFTLSIITVSVASMALFGAIILIPLYVQQVLDLSPLVSGLLISITLAQLVVKRCARRRRVRREQLNDTLEMVETIVFSIQVTISVRTSVQMVAAWGQCGLICQLGGWVAALTLAMQVLFTAKYALSVREPNIQVWQADIRGDRSLTLHHVQDRRRPLAKSVYPVLRYLHQLWGFPVKLHSIEDDDVVRRYQWPLPADLEERA